MKARRRRVSRALIRLLALAAFAFAASGGPDRGGFLASPPSQAPTGAPSAAAPGGAASGEPKGWLDIDYGPLVDTRRLSHSGESIGTLLGLLGGRPMPRPGERPDDAVSHILLDPLLEPYAFVLPDALDSVRSAPDPPMVDIGDLWPPGGPEPAWAELLRSRRYVVESDGEGKLRVFLPWQGGDAPSVLASASETPGADAARRAWDQSWPVLRHVLAAERRRLARRGGSGKEGPALEVEVHAYRHEPEKTLFHLGLEPHRVRIDETRGRSTVPALDLGAWQGFLDKGLVLEGARLQPDGTVRLIGSEPPRGGASAGLLGRPITLADFAVAYRAVFQGGVGEPYMSLDRGNSPDLAIVNYGGRLQDTSLGLVSLLCDVRFKTFSLGIDVLAASDVRPAVRRALPSFRTHMERFAADPRSARILTQQTRLWFYPDSVDLTLSPEGDVLVLRRVRMSAASERLGQESFTAKRGEQEAPWTRETIAGINADYDVLSSFFPELADLDQVVRLLSFFTWLRQERDDGVLVPDLDALLALELPSAPTPRRFPQLLAYSAMPGGGAAGPVDVFDRHPVVEALERLLPPSGAPLAAATRFRRALAALDRGQKDHAALAREIESTDTRTLDDSTLDLLSYRAERLRMHQLVLNTLPADARAGLERREAGGEKLRTISTGIGGLDLGMSPALARAARRGKRVSFGGDVAEGGRAARGGSPPGTATAAAGSGERARAAEAAGESASSGRGGASPAGGEAREDSSLIPAIEMPEHGLKAVAAKSGGKPGAAAAGWLRRSDAAASRAGAKAGAAWTESVAWAEAPDPRSRRVLLDAGKRAMGFERLDSGAFLRYRIDRGSAGAAVRLLTETLAPGAGAEQPGDPWRSVRRPTTDAPAPTLPAGLASIELLPGSDTSTPADAATGSRESNAARDAGPDGSSLRLRLRGIAGRDLEAAFPRALLQRLVLGRETDLAPDRPLSGLSPAEKVLGGQTRVMAIASAPLEAPPWAGPDPRRPGEEDTATFARALSRWWAAEAQSGRPPTVAVGTDPAASTARWERAPQAGGKASLLLPDDAFPGSAKSAKERVLAAWKGGEVLAAPPPSGGSPLVVLASAEAPALLGTRLRRLARDPAMKGKLLAVWPLGGPVRPDLPSSLMAEGNLAGIGLAEYSPVGLLRAAADLGALRARIGDRASRDLRPEDLSGALLWYY